MATARDFPLTLPIKEELDTAYLFAGVHVRSHMSCGQFSKAMMCERIRCRGLELTEDEEEKVMVYKKECAYGECDECGVEKRLIRCPCEDTSCVSVKLREYQLQPRTVKGEDDDGNPVSSTKGVNELTEITVTGKELLDKIETSTEAYLSHCWNCTWANVARKADMRHFGPTEMFAQSDFAAAIENASQDNVTCSHRQHTNLDVFVVAHSPRMVTVPVAGSGSFVEKRVVTSVF